MNIFQKVKAIMLNHLSSYADSSILERVSVNFPTAKTVTDADFATNICMILKQPLNKNVAQIGDEVIAILIKDKTFSGLEFVNGFINISMSSEFWKNQLEEINSCKNYGFSDAKGEKINIEYVSANPTGPIHVGHTRGAVYGSVLSNILIKNGYDVTQEYYINDAGSQVNNLIASIKLRTEQIKNDNITNEDFPKDLYPGEYIIDIAKKFISQGENVDIRSFVLSEIMSIIKEDLGRLCVNHDVFTSEQKIIDDKFIEKAMDILNKKNLLYKGVIEKPKGMSIEDWEEKDQLLFKSTQFGDDIDRPLQKSDGTWAYFAPDIGYHLNKFERGFNKMILILGADHKGYKKRISSAVKAISDGKAEIDVKLYELVNLTKNGEQVKMSKRAGNFITLGDVLDEVDPQIIRFTMLAKKADTVMDFDLEKVKEQSKDNHIFYIQYSYSRCCSVKEKISQLFGQNGKIDVKYLDCKEKIDIIKKLSEYPVIMENMVKNYDIHVLTYYLYDLASMFHSLWGVGNIDYSKRLIDESNNEKTLSNIVIVEAMMKVIESGLDCFGIKAMKSM
jgi:arginyl-tRNA synthetase